MAGVVAGMRVRSLGLLAACAVVFAAPGASQLLDGRGKLGFDPAYLDDQGLYGPPDGRRALDYEFCIPASADVLERVSDLDPSIRFYPGAAGRVGCAVDQVLALGNTHQTDFRDVLDALEALLYVERIEPAWFE